MANPYFNAAYYLANNPDVAASGLDPETHYLQFGAKEGRAPTSWFNGAYYLAQNPDLQAGGITIETAFAHFQAFGANEGRSPSPTQSLTDASLSGYAAANADIAAAFGITDPAYLTSQQKAQLSNHFYQFGVNEDRPGNPFVAPVGGTFTLTTSADAFTGTAGNDVFNGGLVDSFSAFDNLDGGAGKDTVNAFMSGTGLPGGLTLKSIENLNINATGAGFTVDTTAFAGIETVKVNTSTAGAISVTGATSTAATVVGTGASNVAVIGTGGALSVTTGAGTVDIGQTAVVNALTAAAIVGGTTVKISDNKTTTKADGNTLTTVSLKGNAGAATLDANGLTTLTLTDIVKDGADTTINAAAGTRTLTVNVSGIDDDALGTIAVTDATATTLNINATGVSKDLVFNAGAATSVAIAAEKALTIDNLNAGVATSVAISGAAKTTITADTLAAAAVVTSTSTGGVAITQALTANQQFVGTKSTGADSISIATSSTKAHSTGAGDDTVIIGGAFATGGSVDAGEGVDTLSLTEAVADAAAGLSKDATFAGSISGFERLSLNTVTGTKTVNLANLDNINHVTTTAATGLTLSNLASNGTLVLTAAANTVAVGVTDALTGTADVLNINLTQTADTAFGTVTASNVETLNIVSTDSNTTVAGTTDHTLAVVNSAAKAIVVTGNAHLTLTQASTALTSIDASGMTVSAATTGANTQGLNFTSADLAAAATATGSSGVDTLDFSAVSTSKSMTINGGLGGKAGAAGDTLIGGAGDDTITFSGLGNATLTGNAGKDTITGGAGNDTITGGAGADTLNGNGGNDIFSFTLASHSAPTAYDTISDFVAKTTAADGDVLQFSATTTFGGAASAVGVVVVADNGSLALAALSAAAVGADVVNFALDKSTGTLYIDGTSSTGGTSDGTADMAILLTGVNTIDANAIAFV